MGNSTKKITKRTLLAGTTVAAVLALSAVGSASAAESSPFGVKAQNQDDETISAVRGLQSSTNPTDPETTTPPVVEPTEPPVTEEPTPEPTPEAPDYYKEFGDLKIVSYDPTTRILKLNYNPSDKFASMEELSKPSWSLHTATTSSFSTYYPYGASSVTGNEVYLSQGPKSYLRIVIRANGGNIYIGPTYYIGDIPQP